MKKKNQHHKRVKNIENKSGALLNGLKNERLLMKNLIDENKASSQKNQETKASTQKILTNLPTNRNV